MKYDEEHGSVLNHMVIVPIYAQWKDESICHVRGAWLRSTGIGCALSTINGTNLPSAVDFPFTSCSVMSPLDGKISDM